MLFIYKTLLMRQNYPKVIKRKRRDYAGVTKAWHFNEFSDRNRITYRDKIRRDNAVKLQRKRRFQQRCAQSQSERAKMFIHILRKLQRDIIRSSSAAAGVNDKSPPTFCVRYYTGWVDYEKENRFLPSLALRLCNLKKHGGEKHMPRSRNCFSLR